MFCGPVQQQQRGPFPKIGAEAPQDMVLIYSSSFCLSLPKIFPPVALGGGTAAYLAFGAVPALLCTDSSPASQGFINKTPQPKARNPRAGQEMAWCYRIGHASIRT